jgi:molecular chaperone IbpA
MSRAMRLNDPKSRTADSVVSVGPKLLTTQNPVPTLMSAKAQTSLAHGRRRCPALSDPCCSQEDVAMRTFDISPLYRSTVGFDRLFDMLDQTARVEPMTNWPPYNIEKAGDDQYRITMAVAGFSPDEIELTQHGSALLVTGHKGSEEDKQYLHRGIATRAFKQTFNLADHVKVKGASLENGLLTVDLVREVPEALKPRRIEIATNTQPVMAQDNAKQIEHEPQTTRAA